MFEDTNGVIGSRKSKDKQYNGQKNKNQRTSNDLHVLVTLFAFACA